MKHLYLIVNGILAVAVAILFFLHFRDCSKVNSTKIDSITNTSVTKSAPGSTVVYVDLDSLESNYVYYRDRKGEFEKSQKTLEATLTSGMESLQRQAYEFEKKAQTMTQAEGEATQQRLGQEKNRLEQLRDNGAQNLQSQMSQFNIDVYAKIDSALQDYNKDHKYAYVLSYQRGGAILYRDKGLDITSDVVGLLNKMSTPAKK
jgi:outer membrane protein